MNRMRKCLLVLAVASGLVSGAAYAKENSLYQRLGGYDAIAALTDDFLGRLTSDDEFRKFFVGMSNDTKGRIRQHIVEFFCQATGGPCVYTGRDMKTVHTGLGITENEWKKSVVYIGESMNALKIAPAEQKDLGMALAPLEKDIVEQK